MGIIKKLMIYLGAFFFILSFSNNIVCLSTCDSLTKDQIVLKEVNFFHKNKQVFFEQFGQIQNKLIFNYVKISNILLPANCQKPFINKIDPTYKNFHIFISAMPIYKIEQLSEHHFPTTLPL